jgi:hypothetical protein
MGVETALSVFLAAVFVGILGILIKYFGMVDLVAGYDPESVTDTEGLADFVGTNALYVAGISAAVAVGEYTQPFDGYETIWVFYVLGVVLIAVRMVRGARKYEASQ